MILVKFNFNFGMHCYECRKLKYTKNKKQLELWVLGDYFITEKKQDKHIIRSCDGDRWRTIAMDKLNYLEIEIGSRKYTFIDFSDEELEELAKGEGLE